MQHGGSWVRGDMLVIQAVHIQSDDEVKHHDDQYDLFVHFSVGKGFAKYKRHHSKTKSNNPIQFGKSNDTNIGLSCKSRSWGINNNRKPARTSIDACIWSIIFILYPWLIEFSLTCLLPLSTYP
jgi:hypothetical protein